MSRPRSYALAAVLLLLFSLLSAAIQIPTLAQGAPAPTADAPPFALSLLAFTLAILGIVAAYGVWRVQKWGVVLAIVIAGLAILSSLPAIIFAPLPNRLGGGLGVVWAAAIIVLLLRPAPPPALA